MLRTFVSFSGRIGRQTFWFSFLAVFIVSVLVIVGVAYVYGVPVIIPNQKPDFSHPYFMATGLVTLFSFWPYLAIYVKRLHDRDMRGWWLLLPYVLMLLPVAVLIAMNPQMMAMMSGGGAPAGGGLGGMPIGGVWMMGGLGLFYVIGLILLLWLFIVTGFLRGTNGPNRFGPDPLGGTGVDAVPEGHDWAN